MQIWRNQVLNRWVRVKARGEEEKELTFVVRPTAVTVMNIYWNYVTLTGQHKLTLLWHKKKYIGNYLAVQWFGFHASSIAEAWVCSLVRELRSWELSATQFSSVQWFSRVRLFETPWTAACQASLSSTNSQSPPKPIPSSPWCHPTISSSVVPFSSCPQSFPASGSFPMSQLFASGGQSIGVSASTSVPPMNTQDWSPLGWTGWISLQSKRLSRVFSNTTVQKHQFFSAHLFSQSNSHIHTCPLEKQ